MVQSPRLAKNLFSKAGHSFIHTAWCSKLRVFPAAMELQLCEAFGSWRGSGLFFVSFFSFRASWGGSIDSVRCSCLSFPGHVYNT
jgi:hypothetical protein